ncbi:hypothetical protein BH11PSE13_BH11PSE13_35590 [soil metagenome]
MTKSPKVTSRLGTQTRSRKAQKNGHNANSRLPLFESYSPKARTDVRFGNLGQFVHFLCCEGNPSIQQVDYVNRHFWPEGNRDKDDAGLFATIVDSSDAVQILILGAESTRSERDIEKHAFYVERTLKCYPIRNGNAPTVGLVFSTVLEIKEKFEIRIRNWFEIIPWIAQVRNHHLSGHLQMIQELLRVRASISAAELRTIEKQDAKLSGLLVAAAFKGAGAGLWGSDLDTKALSTRTMFGTLQGDVK